MVMMVLQGYREQAASENKTLSEIFDAKLDRARCALHSLKVAFTSSAHLQTQATRGSASRVSHVNVC